MKGKHRTWLSKGLKTQCLSETIGMAHLNGHQAWDVSAVGALTPAFSPLTFVSSSLTLQVLEEIIFLPEGENK